MRRAAILAMALLLTFAPTIPAFPQQPRPATSGFGLGESLHTIQGLLDEAAQKCLVEDYKKAMRFLVTLRDEARAAARAGRGGEELQMTLGEIEQAVAAAERQLQVLQHECARQRQGATGDSGKNAGPTSADLDKLWADAQKAYFAHAQAAANCDLKQMAIELAMLEYLVDLANQAAAAVRADPFKSKVSPAEANFTARAITTLRDSARGRGPINCPGAKQVAPATGEPKIAPPPPPAKGGGTKDCPVPGGGGSGTPPEHGMLIRPPDQASEQLFAAHNRARAEAGVPPLIWSPELAARAGGYAVQLSQVGLTHAPRPGRKCERENLLQSLRGGRTPEQMFGVWLSEKRNFVPGIFPSVSRTGNWADVGHYTQVIWRSTTHVGCAIRSDARHDWLVCRYSPPGNRDGSPVL